MIAIFFVFLVQEFLTPPNYELLLGFLASIHSAEFVLEFSFQVKGSSAYINLFYMRQVSQPVFAVLCFCFSPFFS